MESIKKGMHILLLLFFVLSDIQAQQNGKVIIDYQTKIQSWLDEYKVPAVGIGIINDGEVRQVMVFGDLKKMLQLHIIQFFKLRH